MGNFLNKNGVNYLIRLIKEAMADMASGLTNAITPKADKVANATNGNLAALDANGNLTDSGYKASDFVVDLVVSTTYSELKALRDGENLVEGTWYRITDYTCTTNQADTQSAGHVFDIIVRADNVNILNENAYAAHHSGDTYFQYSKLEAWELKYCIDNDADRFAWADSTNGKGVIFYMKDEFGNICGYDFKNILMKFYKITDVTTVPSRLNNTYSISKVIGTNNYTITSGCTVSSSDTEFRYTFDLYSSNTHSDHSLNTASSNKAKFCYDNVITPMYGFTDVGNTTENKKMWINFISFRNANNANACFGNKFSAINHNISFGNACFSNTFGDYCYSNTFGNSCCFNTFGNYCSSNIFEESCKFNTLGDYFTSNTFGVSCSNNIFGKNCSINKLGRSYNSNTFGNYCTYNTFGNSCQSNTFGNYCTSNTFGNYCESNTFKDYCSSNTFMEECLFNMFGNNCGGNILGNGCANNTFGNGCANNTFRNYVRQLTVFEGVTYCDITGGSSNNYIQNAQILNGTSGTNNSNLLTITFVANVNYTQIAGKNSSGVLKIWTPADISTQLDNILTIIQNI